MKPRKEEASEPSDIPLSLERYLDLACAAREQRERRLALASTDTPSDPTLLVVNQ